MIRVLEHIETICDDLMKTWNWYTRVISLTFADKDPERGSCFRSTDPEHKHHKLNLRQSYGPHHPYGVRPRLQGLGQALFIRPSLDDLWILDLYRWFQAGGTRILQTVGGTCWRTLITPQCSRSTSGGVTPGLDASVRDDANELGLESSVSKAVQHGRGKNAVVGVVFDGDDTLWCTEQLYDDARWNARRIVVGAGLDGAKWEELERGIDVANVAILGYSMERFPTSCVLAYEKMCRDAGRTPETFVADRIRHAARSVFERNPPLVSGARETLTCLRARGTRLALLTKGDAELQSRRIESSGLRDLFHVVQIVPEKSPTTIRSVVASLSVNPESAWMVGNSIRSDVLPAIAAGIRAIWINAHVWEYERAYDHLVDERVITISRLVDIPDLVAI